MGHQTGQIGKPASEVANASVVWARTRAAVAVMLVWIVTAVAGPPTCAQTLVDLELALTVDISLSMDLDEQRLQRDGYVAAFRDPGIWSAIQAGPRGRIAVTYIEWAGAAIQITVLPWTLIDGPEAAQRFADALELKPISRHRMTSISSALRHAGQAIEQNPFKGTRQVIDVSGDGPNNAGEPVVVVRDQLVAKGIVINGLPLLLKLGGPNSAFDIPNLDDYYADCVIGGTGAFSLPVRDKSEFGAAIRQKLMLEIAGLRPELRPRLIHTQDKPRETADCLVGEKQWRRYMDDRLR